MLRKQLSKSDIHDLNARIEHQFGVSGLFGKKDAVLKLDADTVTLIVRDKIPLFIVEHRLIPTMKLLLDRQLLKSVTVDMGAVRFVTNGADVMRPGIMKAEEGMEKGDLVVVVDETHRKPLAVCEALFAQEELMAMASGKVLKNLHYVGDKVWNTVI